MKKTRTPVTAFMILVASALVGAQNAEMQHRDGTTTGGSRGGINTSPVGLYQRFPADQTRGATTIHEFNILLQDQNASTLENVTLVIRRNLAGGPATGSPDISAAGVIGGTIFNGLSFGSRSRACRRLRPGHLPRRRASAARRERPRGRPLCGRRAPGDDGRQRGLSPRRPVRDHERHGRIRSRRAVPGELRRIHRPCRRHGPRLGGGPHERLQQCWARATAPGSSACARRRTSSSRLSRTPRSSSAPRRQA